MSAPSLSALKNNVEKAIDRLKAIVRPISNRPVENPTAITDFLYTHPNVNQVRTTWLRRWNAARLELRGLVSQTQVDDLAAEVLAAADLANAAIDADKKRLSAKRANLAAKAAQKKDLDLQEGVSLAGVDVGQYEVILAGLEPVRKFVHAMKTKELQCSVDEARTFLTARGYVFSTKPDYNGATDRQAIKTINLAHDKKEQLVRSWFERKDVYTETAHWTLRPDNAARIESKATKFALAYVQGYAVKLAVKTGEQIANTPALVDTVPTACSVSTTNLWGDSTARITLKSALVKTELVFHTQLIWNRSCLGKVFNQYPTRLVEAGKGGAK